MKTPEYQVERREFTGWFIPVSIIKMFDKDRINMQEMVLLASLDSLSKTKGFCYANTKFLASSLKVSHRRIYQLLNHLESEGLIRRRPDGDGLRRIYVRKGAFGGVK